MKSRLTPLASRTSANGPMVVGAGRPSRSARKAAERWRSLAATIVWFSWTGMRGREARRRPSRSAVGPLGQTAPVDRVLLLRRGEGLVEAREWGDDGAAAAGTRLSRADLPAFVRQR